MYDREESRARIAAMLRRDPARTTDDALLSELVDDSFALVELMIELQEELGLRSVVPEELRSVRTVGELLDQLSSAVAPAAAGG
jgi:acyl carrier protein